MAAVKSVHRTPVVTGSKPKEISALDGLIRNKVFAKSTDMIKFDEDEGDGKSSSLDTGSGQNDLSDGGYGTQHKDDGSVANILSLYVHPEDEDGDIDELADLDSLPGDEDDPDEDPEDVVGPLTSPAKVDTLPNSFYHSRRLFANPNGYHPRSLLALSERSCPLSSEALNQIMVNRGASSSSESSSPSPLSRSSPNASHLVNRQQSVNNLAEKVILLPRVSANGIAAKQTLQPINYAPIKCDHINCTDATCQSVHLHNLFGLWSDKRMPIMPIASPPASPSPPNANNVKVSSYLHSSTVDDPNVLRLHVAGQSRSSRKGNIQSRAKGNLVPTISKNYLPTANRYSRLNSTENSSSSPTGSSSSSISSAVQSANTLSNHFKSNLDHHSNDHPNKRTWRQCKNSSEVILIASPQSDHSNSCSPDQLTNAKADPKRKFGSMGVRLTADQALARYHRQFTCEAVSLIVLIIAVTFLIATPFILIPMVAFPSINQDLIRVILWLSLLLSIIFTIIGALIGNVYWYFDEPSSTFKWKLHFGSGPKHYWGSTLFNLTTSTLHAQHQPRRPDPHHRQQSKSQKIVDNV